MISLDALALLLGCVLLSAVIALALFARDRDDDAAAELRVLAERYERRFHEGCVPAMTLGWLRDHPEVQGAYEDTEHHVVVVIPHPVVPDEGVRRLLRVINDLKPVYAFVVVRRATFKDALILRRIKNGAP